MNLSIIIPNYNGENLLRKNLPKVLEAAGYYKDGKVEIIITDDGSTDGSMSEVKNFLANLKNTQVLGKIVENTQKKHRGFSSNANRGVKAASGEVVILLNTDVVPRVDFLDALISHFKNPEIFAVGCMDESIEKGKHILRGRGIGGFKRGFLMHRKAEPDNPHTLWVSCGSGAFRKSVWEKLGGLDQLYNPFYWEDIDLSYRAQKSGYKVVFESKSVVVHEHDKGTIKTIFDRAYVKQIAYRNQFIFMWKNVTDSSLIVEHILFLPYHFLKAVISLDFELLKGFLHALMRFDKIMKARKVAKIKFIKSDKEVMQQYV
jgi:GT2 family glycosyltransferase